MVCQNWSTDLPVTSCGPGRCCLPTGCVPVCVCVPVCFVVRDAYTHTHTLNTLAWAVCVAHIALRLTFLPPTDPGPRTHVSIGSNIKHHEPCTNCKLHDRMVITSLVHCTVIFMFVPGVMQLKGKIQENPQMWSIPKRTTDCLAVSQCNTNVQYRHVVICESDDDQ